VDFNAPFADIAIVWAKNEEGRIHGLIVERGMEVLHSRNLINGRFVRQLEN
jgi:glutaryl-CoA dehydrogenase